MIRKTNKVIGIPGYRLEESHFGVGINHIQFVERFGNPRILMPWEEKVEIDLLYLPGGLDTAPANYGQSPSYYTSNQDAFKEFFFKERLPFYIDDTPIFGVCLGMQMLAVQYNCKLVQDLLFHKQSSARWAEAHKVHNRVQKTKAGAWILDNKADKMDVNSHHHQALTLNNVSSAIEPLWFATNEDTHITGDGLIVEGFKIKGKPIFGVQWHPEELYDKFSISTMNELLSFRKPVVSAAGI